MFWFFILIIAGIILIKFLISNSKDRDDLQGMKLEDKFNVIVDLLNGEAFSYFGSVHPLGTWSFNLHSFGGHQIINFHYRSGCLTIKWSYKYYQKEVFLEKQYDDVRNLSLFEQQKIAESFIEEMNMVINNHKNQVMGDVLPDSLNFDSVERVENKEENLKSDINIEDKKEAVDEEFVKVVASGDEDKIREYLTSNSHLINKTLDAIVYSQKTPVKKIYKHVVDKYYDEKDYKGTISLINMGLKLNDKEHEPWFYGFRADCHIGLLNYSYALEDLNTSIELELGLSEKDYYQLEKLYKKRGEVKKKLGDLDGSIMDEKSSNEYSDKFREKMNNKGY